MIKELKTPRLWGRSLELGDYADLRLIHGDPLCSRPMEMPGFPLDEAYTESYLERGIAHWREYGFGIRVFYEHSGDFVGFGGLRHSKMEHGDEISLAFALCNTHWNKGLGTEMAKAFLAEGFLELHMTSVIALAFPDNLKSRRSLEKAGLSYERNLLHGGFDHVLYRIESN